MAKPNTAKRVRYHKAHPERKTKTDAIKAKRK